MKTIRENDYDGIVNELSLAIDEMISSTHALPEQVDTSRSDSVTVNKDGYINSIIRLQRLKRWVSGLSKSQTVKYQPQDTIGGVSIKLLDSEQGIDELPEEYQR